MTYPKPKKYLLEPVKGGHTYLVPVALEGYDRGYEALVRDHYEIETTYYAIDGKKYFVNQWKFKDRLRVWTRPLHYDHNGKSYRCEECERYWAEEPSRPDEVLLTWDDLQDA